MTLFEKNVGVTLHKVMRGYQMLQWPPHSKITCFNFKDEVIAESKRSRLDFSDSSALQSIRIPISYFSHYSRDARGTLSGSIWQVVDLACFRAMDLY